MKVNSPSEVCHSGRDKISLIGLVLFGRHGVSAEEKRVGQDFLVDVDMYGDFSRACQDDDLKESVDYAQVYVEIKKIVEGAACNLLEAVAQRISDAILGKFKLVEKLRVRVTKPHVPIQGTLEGAAVEIVRSRKNQ